MHRRAALIVAATLCSLSPLLAKAQSGQPPVKPPAEVRDVTIINASELQAPTPAMPAARDGWVVEVITSGGIMGGARRTVLDSAGNLTCPSSCASNAPPRALAAVTSSVDAASRVVWSAGAR